MSQQKQSDNKFPFIFKCTTCGVENRYSNKQRTKKQVRIHKNQGHNTYWKVSDKELLKGMMRDKL